MKIHGWITGTVHLLQRREATRRIGSIGRGIAMLALFEGCARPGNDALNSNADARAAHTEASTSSDVREPLVPCGTTHTVQVGGLLTLSANDPNCANCNYMWVRNGQEIAGATGKTFTIQNFQPTTGGTYAAISFRNDGTYALMHAMNVVRVSGNLPNGRDALSGAEAINGNNGWRQRCTANSTSEPSEPAHADWPAAKSIWFRWQAPGNNKKAIFDTEGSTFPTRLAVYVQTNGSGSPSFADLEAVTADEASGPGASSRVQWDAENQKTYYIAVDGAFAGTGEVGHGVVRLGWDVGRNKDGKPAIQKQPDDQFISFVDNVPRPPAYSFSVQIRNHEKVPHSFTWYRSGSAAPISTETNDSKRSTYTNRAPLPSHGGSYFVVITNLATRKHSTSRLAGLNVGTDESRLLSVGNAGTLATPISQFSSSSLTKNGKIFNRYVRFQKAFGWQGSGVSISPTSQVSSVTFWTTNCDNAGLDTYILTSRTAYPYTKTESDDVPGFQCSNTNQMLSGTNHSLVVSNYHFTIYYRSTTLPAGRTNIAWGFRYGTN